MGFSPVPAWQAMEASNFSSLQAAIEILLMAGDLAVSGHCFTQETRKEVHKISEGNETLKGDKDNKESKEEGGALRGVEGRIPEEVKEEEVRVENRDDFFTENLTGIENREDFFTENLTGNSLGERKLNEDVEEEGMGRKNAEREEGKETERNVSLEMSTKGLKSIPGLRKKGGSVLNSLETTSFSKENSPFEEKKSKEEKKRRGQYLQKESDFLGREKKRRMESNGEKGERKEISNSGEDRGDSRKLPSIVKQEPESFSPSCLPKEGKNNSFLFEWKVGDCETKEKKNFEKFSEGRKTEDPDWLKAAKVKMQKHFGFSNLKPFQIEALLGWAEGRDTFVLAATGSVTVSHHRKSDSCHLSSHLSHEGPMSRSRQKRNFCRLFGIWTTGFRGRREGDGGILRYRLCLSGVSSEAFGCTPESGEKSRNRTICGG